MEYELKIPGRLQGLNNYISALNKGYRIGNAMKQHEQEIVEWHIVGQLKGAKIEKPVIIHYTWYEKPMGKMRDCDNISGFGHKVIQDALVCCGVLPDDSPHYIKGYTDAFNIVKTDPCIIVRLEEIEE